MDRTLLRKLTRKSTLKFGQYCDSTVQDCLTFYRFNYLRWVYFNCSMITFMDDILDEIYISNEYRIKKPGVDAEKHEILCAKLEEKMRGLTKCINKKRVKKQQQIKYNITEKQGSSHFTKYGLQRKNQGVNRK